MDPSSELDTRPGKPTIVCPACHGPLKSVPTGLGCPACPADYPLGDQGFVEFETTAGGALETSPRLEEYAGHQEEASERRYRDFLLPWVASTGARAVLDAGCGVGAIADRFALDGFEAYGVDLPKASRFWADAGRSPERFFCADVTNLPFADGSFDAVLSMGVIEHVGTATGHCTLAQGYQGARAAYARELMRVLRPGGRLLVSCPNKSFPVDIHHGPGDALTQAGRVRRAIGSHAGLNIHRTWGAYHLLSFPEVRSLFRSAGASDVVPLPAKGYFAFDGLADRLPGQLSNIGTSVVRAYVEGLPVLLRGTAFDPFVIAEIRR